MSELVLDLAGRQVRVDACDCCDAAITRVWRVEPVEGSDRPGATD